MLVLLALPFTFAADPSLVYDVTVNGQAAGTRELNIQYFPRADGERRVVQLVSHLKLGSEAWNIRATSSSGPRGATFTSSMDHNGELSQVQAIELPEGGWRVTTSDRKGNHGFSYARDAARLSTLDLYDPGRTWRLGSPGPFGLLLSESGDAISGQLSEPTDLTLTIAGIPVPVRHYVISGSGAAAAFDLDVNGMMVRSELTWMGMQVVSTLRQPPPARTIEQIQTIEDFGTMIQEQPL